MTICVQFSYFFFSFFSLFSSFSPFASLSHSLCYWWMYACIMITYTMFAVHFGIARACTWWVCTYTLQWNCIREPRARAFLSSQCDRCCSDLICTLPGLSHSCNRLWVISISICLGIFERNKRSKNRKTLTETGITTCTNANLWIVICTIFFSSSSALFCLLSPTLYVYINIGSCAYIHDRSIENGMRDAYRPFVVQ